MPDLPDQHVRLAAFEWLRHQIDLQGEVLPWSLLARGFDVDGQRVPLLSQQGIFKPRLIPDVPLSIRT
ncbi:MAG: HNH endonuclease, partial [Myxococcales bacterium]|nr:HNH endonuclease [Myxococcales bacterium]